MLSFAFLVLALLLVRVLVPSSTRVERAAWVALFTLTAGPWALVNAAFVLDRPVSAGLAWGVMAAAIVPAGLAAFRTRAWSESAGDARDASWWPLALVAVACGVFASVSYSDAKFWLSLRSYLDRGEAECFYMLTFRLVDGLEPSAGAGTVRDAYSIISTPGNVLFTAGAWPAFGLRTYLVAHVAVLVLAGVFTALVAERFGARRVLAAVAGVLAVVNPYTLSIEELDRNVIAYMLSAAFAHALLAFPGRTVLHGAVFALAAGTGLRFLPLTLALPLVAGWIAAKVPWRAWVAGLATASVVFAFNVPHLFHHGLESMGERASMASLFWSSLVAPTRTPHLPFPNAVFYALHVTGLLGAAMFGFAGAGLVRFVRERRASFLVAAATVIPSMVVLVSQRDWIEGDKHRIAYWVLVPFWVAVAAGLEALVPASTRRSAVVSVVVSAALVLGGASVLSRVDVPVDVDSASRKPVYQSDSAAFATMYRARFGDVRVLPGWWRTYLKPDLERKKREAAVIRATLFGPGSGRRGGAPWPEGVAAEAVEPRPRRAPVFVNVRIDLDKLVTDPAGAATVVPDDVARFVNLEDGKALLDVYFRAARVSWQSEPLTVTVLPDRPEREALGELTVELNAFASFGADDDGFERVNFIHLRTTPERRAAALRSALTALPDRSSDASIVLRVPSSDRVILRDWIVNPGSGDPYRTDAWDVRVVDGTARVSFQPFEPESHL